MKKLLGILSISLVATSCMKKFDKIDVGNEFASVAVINAAPSATGGRSTAGNLFVDSVIQSASAITYRTASGYRSVKPGTRSLFYMATTTDSSRYLRLPAENFEAKKSYTYILYDSLSTNRTVRSIRLTDNLTFPNKDAQVALVRVIHVAPQGGPVDVTFTRTNVTPADSITVANIGYIGNNPTDAQIQTLSNFNITLPLGFAGTYTIRVKQAGTGNVLTSGTFALSTNAMRQAIATVYITGTVQGQPVTVNVFRHFP